MKMVRVNDKAGETKLALNPLTVVQLVSINGGKHTRICLSKDASRGPVVDHEIELVSRIMDVAANSTFNEKMQLLRLL